ncbi:hypothetical protein L596_009801 [Steinernema carpocapsae]|uniref:Uncharacterized protein n=1 Tax=Steinernema carpocapsae TaxID=34508 RepID=A0A4U5PGD8_STECR|nr:hypothetical protein L596_009801 [Steinernema carpocapsae]
MTGRDVIPLECFEDLRLPSNSAISSGLLLQFSSEYVVHFRKGRFKNNFKEGTDNTDDLSTFKDLKLETFMQFLGVSRDGHRRQDLRFVICIISECFRNICLLHLADRFHAKIVLQRCGDFLRSAPVGKFPLREKLLLAT